MRKYLLDTNILIYAARSSKLWEYIEKIYFPKGVKNFCYVSEVTTMEAFVFAYQNRWGTLKHQSLNAFLKKLQSVPISSDAVRNAFLQIDSYSQNRHKSLKLPQQFSARNMGKHDLWIAATASALDIPLITADKDFYHLDGVFIDLVYINPLDFASTT